MCISIAGNKVENDHIEQPHDVGWGISRRVTSNMSISVGPATPVWFDSYLAEGGFPSA